MLLNRKRNDPPPFIAPDEHIEDPQPSGPTIPLRSRSAANLRIPFLPMIPGVFNDRDVEEAKRNIPNVASDPMFPNPAQPSRGLSEGFDEPQTWRESTPPVEPSPTISLHSLQRRSEPWQVTTPGEYSSNPNAPVPNGDVAPTVALTRPRLAALPDASPMGSSDQPFGTRDRRTQPRDIIADDQQYLRDVQNKPHNKALGVLEGLGQWAASGVGLNLKRVLHPHGTETEQAQRQLNTDLGIQKEQTEAQDARSTIALRDAQTRKIDDLINHPDTSDADKAKLEIAREILKSHPQGFNLNDPADVIAKKKVEDAGIPIPASYGKQAKAGGGYTLGPGQVHYGEDNKPVASVPASEKPEPGSETPAAFQTRARNFRAANAEYIDLIAQEQRAEKVKDKAFADLQAAQSRYGTNADIQPDVIAAQKKADDAQEKFDGFGAKKADAHSRRLQYADGLDDKGEPIAPKAQPKQSSNASAKSHDFSIGAYIQRNKGATEADARAFAQANYSGYNVIP